MYRVLIKLCFVFYCFISNYVKFSFVSCFKSCLLNVFVLKVFFVFLNIVLQIVIVYLFIATLFFFIPLYCIFIIIVLIGPKTHAIIEPIFRAHFEPNVEPGQA